MKILLIFLILTLIGPLSLLLSGKIDLYADYRTANRESAHIAPLPALHPEAIIQVYASRAFSWRGIVSTHTWIATKLPNAAQFTVYQVVGWQLLRGLPPVVVREDIPDRYWFNSKPYIILDIRGKEAEKLIPQIIAAVKSYPYPKEYVTWPGPNSNTFTAHIGRSVPDLKMTLPSNSFGKDFLTTSRFISRTVSGTGYQFSLFGLLGISLAKQEGLEINILGFVYGVSPFTRVIKLPGFGDISF